MVRGWKIKIADQAKYCHLDDQGVLCYKANCGRYKHARVHIPESMRKAIICTHHEPLHANYNSTIKSISRKYYWHSLTPDTREFVNTCKPCQTRKSPKGKKPNDWQDEDIVSIRRFTNIQTKTKTKAHSLENRRHDDGKNPCKWQETG